MNEQILDLLKIFIELGENEKAIVLASANCLLARQRMEDATQPTKA